MHDLESLNFIATQKDSWHGFRANAAQAIETFDVCPNGD
jgi:hypothetical protein